MRIFGKSVSPGLRSCEMVHAFLSCHQLDSKRLAGNECIALGRYVGIYQSILSIITPLLPPQFYRSPVYPFFLFRTFYCCRLVEHASFTLTYLHFQLRQCSALQAEPGTRVSPRNRPSPGNGSMGFRHISTVIGSNFEGIKYMYSTSSLDVGAHMCCY